MNEVGVFISGGEDSRAVVGALSKNITKYGFTSLPVMNREGRVAHKIADLYDIKLNCHVTNKNHYLNIIRPCSRLIGSGFESIHSHFYGLVEKLGLNNFSHIFGGFLADSLLKGYSLTKKQKARILRGLPIRTKIAAPNLQELLEPKKGLFSKHIREQITKRRQVHYSNLKAIRPKSASEWFRLWPSSMSMNSPNLYAGRRMYASYEPFTSAEVVKIAAIVPQEWKTDRRLFQKAIKPFLRKSKWFFHANGSLPYFAWYINKPLIWFNEILDYIRVKSGIKQKEFAWTNWKDLLSSKEANQLLEDNRIGYEYLQKVVVGVNSEELSKKKDLTQLEKRSILQASCFITQALGEELNNK